MFTESTFVFGFYYSISLIFPILIPCLSVSVFIIYSTTLSDLNKKKYYTLSVCILQLNSNTYQPFIGQTILRIVISSADEIGNMNY